MPPADDQAGAPEPSVFTRIIAGELPGRFVWRDDEVAAFLTIAPITPGHTLVVPVEQIDHWTDVPPALWARISEVQQLVGRAVMAAFAPPRVGVMIVGEEVPHCHVHVLGIGGLGDLDFARADAGVDPAVLDDHAERLRAALRDLGHADHVPIP
jgi:diadenosine tetraphosphate (Ap4A) HIT family hydrolase